MMHQARRSKRESDPMESCSREWKNAVAVTSRAGSDAAEGCIERPSAAKGATPKKQPQSLSTGE